MMIEDILGMPGGDGDFIKGGLPPTSGPNEIDQLLGAWSDERGRSVECLLLLDRARRLLSRILSAGRLTDQSGREATGLLHLIDSIGRDVPPIEG